jgi:hypothetical protein
MYYNINLQKRFGYMDITQEVISLINLKVNPKFVLVELGLSRFSLLEFL